VDQAILCTPISTNAPNAATSVTKPFRIMSGFRSASVSDLPILELGQGEQGCTEELEMAKWIFEPGHSAAEFAVRHMMVSHMRGLFKNMQGSIDFDPDNPADAAAVEATINAAGIWTGDDERDAHLRGADFLNVEKHPQITFRSTAIRCAGEADFKVAGDLTLRGVTRPVVLAAHYLGRWQCPYWEAGRDLGPTSRIGFVATTAINRHDFGVSWNAPLDRGGMVVGDEVAITLDVEAIVESDMQRIAGVLQGR
jgi:polyisoprenoid-binding protein YceI